MSLTFNEIFASGTPIKLFQILIDLEKVISIFMLTYNKKINNY